MEQPAPQPRVPLGPLGTPKQVEHELELGLEQVSRDDLARFIDVATEGARHAHGSVFWLDGSSTGLEKEDLPFGDKIRTIVQVEAIRFVTAHATFEDGSTVGMIVSGGSQRLYSRGVPENTEAKYRLYAIRNDAENSDARVDKRRSDRLKILTRYFFALAAVNIGSALFATIIGFTVDVSWSYVPWWVALAVFVTTLVAEFAVTSRIRKLRVPTLNAITLKYRDVKPGVTLADWGSIGSVVAAVFGVVTVLLTLVL